jgi:hypothetical protein
MPAALGLFDNVARDAFHFGHGSQFNPKLVANTLGFQKEDVSRIAKVSVKSVRYDDKIPGEVLERMEEIGQTVNLVAQAFAGDVDKTVTWFRTANPLLGDIAPRDMIRFGRYERLRRFIINAMAERLAPGHDR